jgi:hypothetical protein
MYLRHTTVCKDGKTHTYWRLVRSVRRGRRVVQETVAHLGELDGEGRTRARRLALQITGRREQYELFEAAAAAGGPVAVRLVGARNRAAVMLDWTWAYLTYRRSIRLITGAEPDGMAGSGSNSVVALPGRRTFA